VSSNQKTVLVVDDRPSSRYPVVHALSRAGFEVIEASSGKEALDLAKQVPSAILLDVKLPDILGYEVCRRLKTNPHTSHIPVLQLSTAFLDNESRVYALESGADAYLTQPVEPNVLIATVKSLVRLHDAESKAKLSAKQWQATFDALSEGVAVVNNDGIIQRCNRAMTELLSRSYVEIEGQQLTELLQDCLGLKMQDHTALPAQEVPWGSQHFRIKSEPVLLGDVPTGIIFILADVTHQKLAERAALFNERLAATGRMANTIAHEINNPLEAITNLLYLLRNTSIGSESAMEYLRSAEAEVERVSRIARQILSFHRESASPVEVNLADLMQDVLALNNRAIVEKNLRVITKWNSDSVIHGFPAQLRQVFSNLVRNAIEASGNEMPMTIKISGCKLWNPLIERGARITISDRGIGIPSENLRRVFDAFFTTKELKGTGVGLWLSSTIVQEHRGRIQVRSNTHPEKSGTCISVLLPTGNSHAL
jgi:two-component system NtrC family sensor kinase